MKADDLRSQVLHRPVETADDLIGDCGKLGIEVALCHLEQLIARRGKENVVHWGSLLGNIATAARLC